MKAVRISKFGSPDVIQYADIACPEPGIGQPRVRVKAAGVGPWDALVREGKSEISQTLPLTLGSDIAGSIDAMGASVSGFHIGDDVYGVTNQQFTGAYAEYALASAMMMAPKPRSLSFVEAASSPVVAVTAWQMLFDYAHVVAGQKVFVQGGAGNVGAYAVQLARQAKLHVVATASTRDIAFVRSLGAEKVVDYQTARIEDAVTSADAVIDTVGGAAQERLLSVLKPGGILVSSVSQIPEAIQQRYRVKAVFFLVEVTTARLNKISELFDRGKLAPQVGTVLPLEKVRTAHEMLAGAPHDRGKIVLQIP